MQRPPRLWTLVLLGACLTISGRATADGTPPPKEPQRVEVRVGIDDGDIRGSDQRALQAAVDYVAGLGGGTVHIGPGRYQMRNALTLRDNVRIIGVPGKTVLAACDGMKVRLASDGDCNERQLTLEDASGFRIGDGVAVWDERNAWGYTVTTATLTAQVDARTFRISAPLYLDYMVRFKASAALAFPVVGGWRVKNAAVEGLTIDGNRSKSAHQVDGCRAGGIYLAECEQVTIRHCVVRNYNGDGIVLGVSHRVTVEDCLSENNAGLGLHPGSGSQSPVFRRNRSAGNGGDGLFVCWRVRHGLFEDNEFEGNKGSGISIGHKDSDNRFLRNTITGNGKAGVLFREESEAMGAHRNIFENNRILDNGTAAEGDLAEAAIVIRGHHHDVVFRKNVIGYSKSGAARSGILAGPHANGLRSEDNEFRNVQADVRQVK